MPIGPSTGHLKHLHGGLRAESGVAMRGQLRYPPLMQDGERVDGEGQRPGGARGLHAGLVLDGRYRLERRLAEGGMGSIWVGHQIALEREVVVKLLRVGSGPLRARL